MMKRLLFIAAMLVSVAYGQSKVYIRGDSIVIQKFGGNGELILENGTRSVTGGVLTNIGNGRTAFVTPSGGGSSDSTFQQITDNNASTTNGITVGQKDSVGSILTYSWNTNPLSATITDNTPSATVSTDGTGTTFTGGGLNTSNYIEFSQIKTGAENWRINFTSVAVLKSSSTFGLALGLTNFVGAGFNAHFRLSDTGWVAYTSTTAVPTLSDDNSVSSCNFQWLAGDTLDFEIRRIFRTYIIEMNNRRTGLKCGIYRENIVFASVSIPRLYTYGGTWKLIGQFTFKYDEYYRPTLLLMGNSISYGSAATSQQTSWWNQVASGYTAVSLTGPSEQSLHGTYKIDDIKYRFKPQIAVIAYGVNDVNAAVNIDSFTNRVTRIILQIRDSVQHILLVNIVPQVTNAAQYNDSLYALALRYNCLHADIYSKLKHPSQVYLADNYSADGIHPNQYGHNVIASIVGNIIDSVATKFYPIKLNRLPIASRYNKVLVLDGDKLAAAFPGTDPNYIWNVPTPSGTNVQPTSGVNISGDIWGRGDLRIGPTPHTSQYLRVNIATGLTTIANLTAGPLSSTSGVTTIDGTGSGRFQITSDPEFRITGNSLRFIHRTATSDAGITIDNDNTGMASSSATYKPLLINHNGAEASYLHKGGGGRFGDTLAYRINLGSKFTARSLVDKNYVDSIAAAIVGGGGGLTGYTDGNGFNGTVDGSGLLSITTTVGNRRLLFSANDFSMTGNDSLVWTGGKLKIPNFGLTGEGLQVGEINLQTALADNSFVGFGVHYDGGFKRTHSGQHGALIYQLSGDIKFQVNASTGSAGSAWTATDAMTIRSSGKIGTAGVTVPTSYFHLTPGSTSATTAPVKYSTGPLMTTPEVGAGEYNNAHYLTNNAINRYGLDGVIFSNSSTVANSTTTVTTLSTYTTKANTLAATEEALYFEYYGEIDDASPVSLVVAFAGTNIALFAPAGTATGWNITGKVVRTGASTATATTTFIGANTTTSVITKLTGLTFSGTNVLLLTGESTTGNTDAITKEIARIKWQPAAAN